MEQLTLFKDLTIYVNKVVQEKPFFKKSIMDLLELCKMDIEDGMDTISAVNRTTTDIEQLTGYLASITYTDITTTHTTGIV